MLFFDAPITKGEFGKGDSIRKQGQVNSFSKKEKTW